MPLTRTRRAPTWADWLTAGEVFRRYDDMAVPHADDDGIICVFVSPRGVSDADMETLIACRWRPVEGRYFAVLPPDGQAIVRRDDSEWGEDTETERKDHL